MSLPWKRREGHGRGHAQPHGEPRGHKLHFCRQRGSPRGRRSQFQSTVTMRSSTLAGNEGSTAAGVYTYDGSFSAVNCIFWNPSGAEIVSAGGASATVTDSVVGEVIPEWGTSPPIPGLALSRGTAGRRGYGPSFRKLRHRRGGGILFPFEWSERGLQASEKRPRHGRIRGRHKENAVSGRPRRALFRFSTAGMEFPSGMGETWSFMGGTSLTVTFVPDAGKAVKEVRDGRSIHRCREPYFQRP